MTEQICNIKTNLGLATWGTKEKVIWNYKIFWECSQYFFCSTELLFIQSPIYQNSWFKVWMKHLLYTTNQSVYKGMLLHILLYEESEGSMPSDFSKSAICLFLSSKFSKFPGLPWPGKIRTKFSPKSLSTLCNCSSTEYQFTRLHRPSIHYGASRNITILKFCIGISKP